MQDRATESQTSQNGPGAAPPAPAPASRAWWRTRRIDWVPTAIVLSAIVLSMVFCAMLAYAVDAGERALAERVRLQNKNLAQAFKLHVAAAFDLVDHTIRRTRQHWVEQGRLPDQWSLGESFPNFKKMIVQVAVIDAHGRLAASSIDPHAKPIYLGDREHFKVHLGSSQDRLFVSQPVIGRVSGRPSVQSSRPIFLASGEFAGVVVAGVDPGFIGDLFAALESEAGGSYGLIGEDGAPRAWVGSQLVSLTEARASRSLRVSDGGRVSGAFASEDLASDAIWHLESLDNAPLTVAVGMDGAALRRQLFGLRLGAWLLGGMLLALTAATAAYLLRAWRRRGDVARRLRDSQRRAAAASERSSRFLDSVAHELRAPLNGILGFSELVATSTDPAQAASYGRLIHQSARQLHEHVNTLLDLATIEDGRMEITHTVCDPRDICEAAAAMHRLAAGKKGLMFEIEYVPDLPAAIHTDRAKLTRILDHVLRNAVSFTLEGRVLLQVGLRDDDWVFRVVDSGVGMSQAQLDGMFDRLRQPRAAAAREPGGGLGMTLCKQLVELLGGRIRVRSAPAQGTTVELLLPRQLDLASPQASPA